MTCNACGVCCDLYGHTLFAAAKDLERWRVEGRADLLARVGPEQRLWMDPTGEHHLDCCPYFSWRGSEHGDCAIHDTKPMVCRAYPTPAHKLRCVMGVDFSGSE